LSVELPEELIFDWKQAVKDIGHAVRQHLQNTNANRVVLGLSGGVDSSVTAALMVKALGSRAVHALLLPERGVTPTQDLEDARAVARHLGLRYREFEINSLVREVVTLIPELREESNRLPLANVKPRIRMTILYAYSNLMGDAQVAGTGDKSELLLGYFCYDERTRAVTTEGPKHFYELRPWDTVFTLNPITREVEEHPLKAVYTFDYQGEMIHFRGAWTDLLVTPNHRMLVVRGDGAWGFEQARDLMGRATVSLPWPSPWRGLISSPELIDAEAFCGRREPSPTSNHMPTRPRTDLLFYLIGLYIGDGNPIHRGTPPSHETASTHERLMALAGGSGVQLTLLNRHQPPVKLDGADTIRFRTPGDDAARPHLLSTLQRLGIPYHAHQDGIDVSWRSLCNVFYTCGTEAVNKSIARWILSYPAAQLRWLLNGIMDSRAYHKDRDVLHTSSERLAFNFVELCFKLGMYAKVVVNYVGGRRMVTDRVYHVMVARNPGETVLRQEDVRVVQYRGKVWCPDVPPHHNLLVERGGKFAFCGNTKYGDGGVDFLPIGDLYKTQVRYLAWKLGLPESIWRKKPSPQLWRGHTAEEEIGAPYEVVDRILYYRVEQRYPEDVIARKLSLDPALVKRVCTRVFRSHHKRKSPPICKLGSATINWDWRMPAE
jgi:NH3-dependent NAD+ synthetase